MHYRPNLGYVYPDRCDEHMIDVPHLRDVNVDENYPFINKALWFRALYAGYLALITLIIPILLKITHGLRVHDKEHVKNNKDSFSKGAITICNHVFYWDYLCMMQGIRHHHPRFPAWTKNLEGPNGPLIRIAGGIPIPVGNIPAMKKFKKVLDEEFESDRWVHFYPEGSMWLYYPGIRPLKKAVFNYAVKYDKPMIPMALSFRERKGITRWFTDKPQVDLNIGEPMFADKSLSPKEAAEKLQKDAYHIMQTLAGIQPDSPCYNTDQNPDHYKKIM